MRLLAGFDGIPQADVLFWLHAEVVHKQAHPVSVAGITPGMQFIEATKAVPAKDQRKTSKADGVGLYQQTLCYRTGAAGRQ